MASLLLLLIVLAGNFTPVGKSWALALLVAFFTLAARLLFGWRKAHSPLNTTIMRSTLCVLVAAAVISYTLGIWLGFSRSYFSLDPVNLLNGLIPTLVLICTTEVLRTIIAVRSGKDLTPLVVFTILSASLSIFAQTNPSSLSNFEQVFVFTSTIILPTLAREALCSFLVRRVGMLPGLVAKIALVCFVYLIPIVPSLGDYIFAIVHILTPYFIYRLANRSFSYYDNDESTNVSVINFGFLTVPIVASLIVLSVLVSGISKYQLIAVASDSMTPTYSRGDAVLFEKTSADKIVVGDVLVFQHSGVIVTHRVMSVFDQGEKLRFQTKGDANEEPDPDLVDEGEVLGKVNLVSKYIGYPTVFITEMFRGET